MNTKRSTSKDRSARVAPSRETAWYRADVHNVVPTACGPSMILQSPYEPPCPGDLQVLTEAKSLTPNHKKKRRQKLAKLGAKHQVQADAKVNCRRWLCTYHTAPDSFEANAGWRG